MFAPFGARGMNSGISDAHVADAAIQAALRATDRDEAAAAIESFATDRHEAARRNRRAAGTALLAMAPRGPRARVRRRVAVAVASGSDRLAGLRALRTRLRGLGGAGGGHGRHRGPGVAHRPGSPEGDLADLLRRHERVAIATQDGDRTVGR